MKKLLFLVLVSMLAQVSYAAYVPPTTDRKGISLDNCNVMQIPTATEFLAANPEFSAGCGDLLADGTIPLTANWDVGAFSITALTFTSDATTGTSPLTIDSTTIVANLNVDQVDGNDASDLLDRSNHTGEEQTADISDNAITFAKMQNMVGASKLLGSGACGAGLDPVEINLGTNLSMCGITINAAGDVASSACLTTNVFPVVDGVKSISTSASILSQNVGNLVIDNGCNDVTFDPSNVTSPVTINFADGPGTMMLEGCVAPCTILMTSATDGLPIASPLTVSCGNVTLNGLKSYFGANYGCATGSLQNFFTFNSAVCQVKIFTGGVERLRVTVAGICAFKNININCTKTLVITTGGLITMQKTVGESVTFDTDKLTDLRTVQAVDMSGVNALWCTSPEFILKADNALQTCGGVIVNQGYEFTVASDACGCFSNVAPGCLCGVIPVGTVFLANLTCTPTNYGGSTIQPVVIVTDTVMRMTSDSAVPTDRTITLSTALATCGQVVTFFWTSACNAAEIQSQTTSATFGRRMKTDAGATLTFNAVGESVRFIFETPDWVQITPQITSF